VGPAALLLVLACASCSTGSEEPVFDNPFDPANGSGLPVPDSVVVAVGNNQVQLSWSLPEGGEADEYAVFRRRLDAETAADAETRLVKRVGARTFLDTGVRNGRLYGYRIAAGKDDRFGERTDEVEARPALFAVALAEDAPRTRNRTVGAVMTAPQGVVAVSLSETSGDPEASWRPYAPTLSWVLSGGDGEKTVYARFRLSDGEESLPVSDSIVLDTRAVIESVDFDGAPVRSAGETMHFRLDAGETGGEARIDVSGLFDGVVLFDDGSRGDATPDDGIHERDVAIPAGKSVTQAAVTGRFTDMVGNVAGSVDAARTLSVQTPPDPIALFPATTSEPPDAPAVFLRWSESPETAFASYRVFRAEGTSVSLSDRPLETISARRTLAYTDEDVVEGRTYAYLVSVRVTSGLETGSDAIQVLVPNLRPPDAVTLRDPGAVASDRVALDWGKSGARDFAGYRIRRNGSGAVSEADTTVAVITDVDRTFFDDTDLRENTEYFYRVYVIDQGGLDARSNEITVVTRNEAPAAVTLGPAADVTSNSAALTWSESSTHDFALYRLYRDTGPTVTGASTLVVEIDERDAVMFTDRNLSAATRYYYRVFVVDDGASPDSLSTGSNTITVQTP
jgi:hypothetical protein